MSAVGRFIKSFLLVGLIVVVGHMWLPSAYAEGGIRVAPKQGGKSTPHNGQAFPEGFQPTPEEVLLAAQKEAALQ